MKNLFIKSIKSLGKNSFFTIYFIHFIMLFIYFKMKGGYPKKYI